MKLSWGCRRLVFKLVRSTSSTSCVTLGFVLNQVANDLWNSEQEHKRTQESSNVDDRTQHEIYAHPFLRSVQAGVASVMCSYSMSSYQLFFYPELRGYPDLINDTYACDNDKMQNDVLKREFGFQGYIMSDWSAQHTTESAMTGLDVRPIFSVSSSCPGTD